jgi:hypothetical protein
VAALDVVELQRAGDRIEHCVGHAGDIALLQPGVVVGRDTREKRDLFATQARNAPLAAVERNAGLLRGELGPPAGQELAHLPSVVHDHTVGPLPSRWGVLPEPG